MRLALVAGLLLIIAAFAGCVNLPKESKAGDVTPQSVDGGKTGGSGGATGALPKILAPLATSIASTSAKWVLPGSSIDVSATAPPGAKAPVTYVWAYGALPGTVAASPATYDTGSKSVGDYLATNQSKSIKFTAAGVYAMHCHPHPYMRSNVTVVDGYAGPSSVEVQIYDYGYAPQNIVVGTNTTVVYKNVGGQPHTATILSNEPALKALPLKEAKGSVTLDGNGWQRVRVFAIDAEGRVGNATLDRYVAPAPAFAAKNKTMTFNAGFGPLAGDATAVQGPQSDSFALDYPGTIYLNYTAQDVTAQNGGPNNAQADVHLKQSGESQDTLTDSGKDKGSLASHAPAGSYTLTILATQGVSVNVHYTIEVVYDLPEPPAPVMAGAGGDGHGDHAGH